MAPDGPDMVPGTIRVLLVIKGLGPGGAERLLVSAAAALDPSAFEVEVAYVLPWKDALVPELEALGVTVHCLGGDDPRDPRWVLRLRRLLASQRYDVVHAHLPVAACAARLAGRSLGRRRPLVVTTEHNAWSTYALPTRIANAVTAVLDDATIAVSDEVRQSIWWPGVRRRTESVVHGVDGERVREALRHRESARAELGAASGDVVIGTVANLRAQKGYPDLLDAARLVLDRAPQARFFAVGQGPLEEQVRARHAELGLGERFRLLGFRPDATRLLAGADVFVLASLYEGYPVALMEAMALGLPVVATAVGGVGQAVHHGVEGLLVPPRHPDLLAEALAGVVGDPTSRAGLAAASRARGADFDVARSVRRMEETYRCLVRAHRSGPPGPKGPLKPPKSPKK
jgi:glycosyltransferase involved in cell wall biosynthesis